MQSYYNFLQDERESPSSLESSDAEIMIPTDAAGSGNASDAGAEDTENHVTDNAGSPSADGDDVSEPAYESHGKTASTLAYCSEMSAEKDGLMLVC
jgi:hypothetical protein